MLGPPTLGTPPAARAAVAIFWVVHGPAPHARGAGLHSGCPRAAPLNILCDTGTNPECAARGLQCSLRDWDAARVPHKFRIVVIL